ncbi:NAD(P)/FAD-dependent oxidoreductase [Pseudoalteromonas sp. T1lg22]|uniref:NAD(P)/FAD-dependent oxidoreductase n=1 Tax=Pseudoalteromonas sp. T1lg22 TaxID=2077096 RepID=UPI000CF69711|nr:FAD-dependent oxidoreductase [Pseudoalteromonas sp. T1lg22]
MKNIAIIGSGIAGLTSAHLLAKKHQVKVFEKNNYIGGHTATVDVTIDGQTLAVDTGFIVFNDRTYPKFEKLLEEIGIGRQPTQMSFSVHHCDTGFEYNGHTLSTLFAQRRNLLRPKFWHLLWQIVRFNRICKDMYKSGDFQQGDTLGEFLDRHGFNDFFRQHYILPMGAAIWSTSLKQMNDFAIDFFVRFFYHHGLLDITNRPQWYVIPGGSREYIAPLTESFKEQIELGAHIDRVERKEQGVVIHLNDGRSEHFDAVVFACHSDQALALLADSSEAEQQVLGAIPYTANSVVLHTDSSLLPKRPAAWASWNYRLDNNVDRAAVVTYNMNILQGLSSEQPLCVTLNGDEVIAEEHILRHFTYHHPVFNQQSLRAQQRRDEINGKQHTYFCGAYWYNGFHEDGVRSAVDVAKALGVDFD